MSICVGTHNLSRTRQTIGGGLVAIAVVVASAACGGDEVVGAIVNNPTNAAPGAANPTAPRGTAACLPVTAPHVESLPTQSRTEPTIGLPVPSGWEPQTALNSQLVRAVYSNATLATAGFAPTYAVTMEDLTGKATADQVYDLELDPVVRMGATVESKVEGTTCGYPSLIADVTLPALGEIPVRKSKQLLVVVESDDSLHVIGITAQAADAGAPVYRADVETVLTELQVSGSTGGMK